MPLPLDLSMLMLTGLCLGTAIAVAVGQAVASAIVALLGPAARARPRTDGSNA